MMTTSRPTDDAMQKCLESLSGEPCGFVNHDAPPSGYVADHFSIVLGRGHSTFKKACTAIRHWKMFPTKMVDIFPLKQPIEVGSLVIVLYRPVPFLWTSNPGKIVHVYNDASNQIQRFGFAYVALSGHMEFGQESFMVEWDRQTDEVQFKIEVFSRPAHWLVWLGYPLARYQQSRFRRLAGEAMQREIDG